MNANLTLKEMMDRVDDEGDERKSVLFVLEQVADADLAGLGDDAGFAVCVGFEPDLRLGDGQSKSEDHRADDGEHAVHDLTGS